MLATAVVVLSLNTGVLDDPPLAFLRAAMREADVNEKASLVNKGLIAIATGDDLVYTRDSHVIQYLGLITSDIPDYLKMDICHTVHRLGLKEKLTPDTRELAIKTFRDLRERLIKAGEPPINPPQGGGATGPPPMKDSELLRRYIRDFRDLDKR
jgi:hypothetical protein